MNTSQHFNGKTLLITGGTGSFGSMVLEKMAQTDIGEIRIFSRDEKKQNDLRLQLNNPKVKFIIGDVRDYRSIHDALVGVDFVFHAAALKQVPSCEFYPIEAVKTNVLGTDNVLSAAIAHGVKKVVVLSTDKAVEPINAMGISKAMMEKVMVAKARITDPSKTLLCGTRYGNVMASRGSVIPLFVSLIKEKKPLLVTDPDMTRFLMPLQEAFDLVMFAFLNAKQGDIFVQKSPASTIHELAVALKEMFQAKNEVRVIGTRHGEKKHETLLNREESSRAEDLKNYYRIPADLRDLNYEKFFDQGDQKISSKDAYTSENTHRLSKEELKSLLLRTDYIQSELKASGIQA